MRLKRRQEVQGVKEEGVAGEEDQQQGEEVEHLDEPEGLAVVAVVLQVQRRLEQETDPPAL